MSPPHPKPPQAIAGDAMPDWSRPWLAPYRHPLGQALADAALVQGQPLHAALNTGRAALSRADAPLAPRHPVPSFVPQAQLPAGQSYEDFIHRQWQVPTRDNLHDLFNGLVWLHFPAAKARLNTIQAAEIRQHGIQPRRGPVRDACTVFDENGALLLAPAPLWQALLARDWLRLFWSLRPLWQQARLVLFGHALLEALCRPRKPLCAHVLTAPWPTPRDPDAPLAQWDAALAQALDAGTLATKPFTPLPVLGVPGWWPANAARSFYEDPAVFRPRQGATPAAPRP